MLAPDTAATGPSWVLRSSAYGWSDSAAGALVDIDGRAGTLGFLPDPGSGSRHSRRHSMRRSGGTSGRQVREALTVALPPRGRGARSMALARQHRNHQAGLSQDPCASRCPDSHGSTRVHLPELCRFDAHDRRGPRSFIASPRMAAAPSGRRSFSVAAGSRWKSPAPAGHLAPLTGPPRPNTRYAAPE